MTRVKICGITSVEDALFCSEAGADALGFIFAQSRRRISPEAAASIIRKLPPLITVVGVFLNQSQDEVKKTSAICGLDVIQLHGDENPEFCAGLGRRVIKRIAVAEIDSSPELLKKIKSYSGCTILLDPGCGDGRLFDWKKAENLEVPVIIGGGLTPQNVGSAIRALKPYGVDVATGVEKSPGVKNPELVRSFIAEVRKW
ncbi:MAG: phosphoribosylanthranilate isomerase [Candidatus Wallbacteria bacterium]|nr:phosphoribosylanthranilate isomerase [Candidatus Wallbacteria bacterium]